MKFDGYDYPGKSKEGREVDSKPDLGAREDSNPFHLERGGFIFALLMRWWDADALRRTFAFPVHEVVVTFVSFTARAPSNVRDEVTKVQSTVCCVRDVRWASMLSAGS